MENQEVIITLVRKVLNLRVFDDEKGTKTYTVKGYYESIDRELDRQAASAAINLSVTKVDKTAQAEKDAQALEKYRQRYERLLIQ